VKIYRVGGSVRDELLGREVTDRDWVVVGAQPDDMLALGYRPVGRDFPVFLHPSTGEEYAMARTERKAGRGYRGFVFHTSPQVTLEEDLRRRDLTINAMARAPDGTLIDPFGGAADLAAGVLRHISPAFAEDPLRVLRVARFAARFGFAVAPQTEALMRALSAGGELATLSPERVWQELARGLMERQPSRLLAVLRDCGALAQVLPEVDALYGVPQPPGPHPELDAGVHVALALDYAAQRGFALAVRYALLAHDLGKAETPPAAWPAHHAHEARSVRLAERMSARLRVPVECRDAARLAARWHTAVHRAAELRPATLLDLLTAADALRRPERLETLLAACEADARSRPGVPDGAYEPAAIVRSALATLRGVSVAAIAREAERKASRGGGAIASAIRAARLAALRTQRKLRPGVRPEGEA
jgi:tRNA nucleotidyltransferase (CCA-adding enzyme)